MRSSSRKIWAAVAATALGVSPLAALFARLTVPGEFARMTLVAEFVLCLILGGACLLLGFMAADASGKSGEPNWLMRYGAGLAAVAFGCLALASLLS